MSYSKIARCRICGNTNLDLVLDLGEQALTGVFPSSINVSVARSPLRLVRCAALPESISCGLLQLSHSVDPNQMFGEGYGYRSSLNQSMVNHLAAKVRKITETINLQPGDLVLDIGSNDGTTLAAYGSEISRIGFDPSAARFKHMYPAGSQLVDSYFSSEEADRVLNGRKAKVVSSFSMFYDLEDPLGFARDVTSVLEEGGIWVLEQSYMPEMLRQIAFDTICHEHLEYYSLSQIKWIAEKTGLSIEDVEFNAINGGSFSVMLRKRHGGEISHSKIARRILDEETNNGIHTRVPYEEFARNVALATAQIKSFLEHAKASNKIVMGLGASTKGNVLLQYAAITPELLQCIGEVNEEKFGAVTPGSLIPIVPEREVLERRADYLLVLPWHFRDFFLSSPSMKGQTLVFPLPKLAVISVK